MKEEITISEKDLTTSQRGKLYHFQDGSELFRPYCQSRGPLYEYIGAPLKDGYLQQSENIFKVTAKADRDSLNPAQDLQKTVVKLLKRLDPKLKAQALEGAVVVGKTAHGIVTKNGDEIEIQFRIPVGSQQVLTQEFIEVCSIISSVSKTPCSPAGKKTTAGSRTQKA